MLDNQAFSKLIDDELNGDDDNMDEALEFILMLGIAQQPFPTYHKRTRKRKTNRYPQTKVPSLRAIRRQY
jgi:hypothetical protein